MKKDVDLKYEVIGFDEIMPYVANQKIHDDEQVKMIASSIKEFGFMNPIIVDKDNVIVAGHGRYEAAKLLGLDRVPILRAEHLSDEQIKAYRIIDNRLAELSPWDGELLKIELEQLENMGFDLGEYALDEFLEDEAKKIEDTIYTKKIEIPVYEPKRDSKPELSELYSPGKAKELLKEIDELDVDDGLKDFFRCAAYRFVEFNFENIAEFYAHSDEKVKDIFEKLALVIVDVDKAIEYGFVELGEKILELIGEEDDE